MTKFEISNGNIIILADTLPDENNLAKLLEPIKAGRAPVCFGVGSGASWPADRLLTIGSNILTGRRLSSMSHAAIAFTKEAYESITVNENSAGVTAEVAAKLSDKGIKAAEVRLSCRRKHSPRLLPVLIAILVNSPLVTYGAVGLVSTLIEWGLFLLFDNLTSFSVALSTAISFILSTVANWFLGRAWSFKGNSGNYSDILPVCIVSTVGLGLSELLMWLLTGPLDIPNFLSKVISTMLVFFWNYLTRKKLVYRNK